MYYIVVYLTQSHNKLITALMVTWATVSTVRSRSKSFRLSYILDSAGGLKNLSLNLEIQNVEQLFFLKFKLRFKRLTYQIAA